MVAATAPVQVMVAVVQAVVMEEGDVAAVGIEVRRRLRKP